MNKNQQLGFTLIELLLYISISGVLLLSLMLFLSTLFSARVKDQSIVEVEQQGTVAMQQIVQTLRNASAINAPAQGASAASLSVNTYSAGSNPTVFDLSNGTLRMTQGPGVPIALTNAQVSVSSFLVTNLSRSGTPGVVRVSFRLSYNNASGRYEYSYAQTFVASASLRQP